MSTRARKTHQKSRGGCNQCKTRRIKCDESSSPCANCVARKTICEYSSRARLAWKARQGDHPVIRESRRADISHIAPSTSTPSSATAASSAASSASFSRPTGHLDLDRGYSNDHDRLLELELMHHWTARTYLTFCHQSRQSVEKDEQKLWQELMPRAALSHEYLLKSLLALSSLHLTTLSDAHVKPRYLEAAISSHNCSLELFSAALSQITDDNVQALFACALANIILGIALREIVPDHRQCTSMEDHLTSVLALVGGAKKIIQLSGEQLKKTQIYNIALAAKQMNLYPNSDPMFAAQVNRLRALNDGRYASSDRERHNVNAIAIQELHTCAVRLTNGVGAALVGWLLSLEESFIQDIRNHEVLATLAVMHWAVLLERPNDLWWSFKSGGSLVHELSESLPQLEPAEQQACDWCQIQVALTSPV